MLVAGMRTQKFCSCQNEESGSGTLSIRMILLRKKGRAGADSAKDSSPLVGRSPTLGSSRAYF